MFVSLQKLLEIEDALEDERKDLSEKIESLESIVRMLELKAKNSSDHGKFLFETVLDSNFKLIRHGTFLLKQSTG